MKCLVKVAIVFPVTNKYVYANFTTHNTSSSDYLKFTRLYSQMYLLMDICSSWIYEWLNYKKNASTGKEMTKRILF